MLFRDKFLLLSGWVIADQMVSEPALLPSVFEVSDLAPANKPDTAKNSVKPAINIRLVNTIKIPPFL
jgi:hypothetical protein